MTGQGLHFAADNISGEAGAEKAAVERGELAVVKFSAEGAKFAVETLADEGGLVVVLSVCGEGGLDVLVGNAACAEIASDAEWALAADFGALASELFGEAGVIEMTFAFEQVNYQLDEFAVVGAPREMLLHFVNGVSAAHEGAEGVVVEGGFGFEAARLGEHEKKDSRSGERQAVVNFSPIGSGLDWR
ncbi:MAG TPA: hypothetical protein VJN42_03635 [Candidatus Acidoferrum sp.]|nr:hypothetical protein [Candidatus Acidoferrum sp.]